MTKTLPSCLRRRLHELFHPGMSFTPGWPSSHPGMTFISVSGHLPLSVCMIWSKNVFAPGWFHPGLQHRDEIILGLTHFCSKSCKHSKVNDQTPRWKSSRDEITHVNGALVLQENYIKFNGKDYLRTHGTVMGANMAVAFANIFMAKTEREILR